VKRVGATGAGTDAATATVSRGAKSDERVLARANCQEICETVCTLTLLAPGMHVRDDDESWRVVKGIERDTWIGVRD
jgi:hypothetical protein